MAIKFIPAKAINRMIRQELKHFFPGVKFSVRKDGHSTKVEWMDGPSQRLVRKLVGSLAGATFDGMTDYKGGRVVVGPDGEEFYPGIDFISTERFLSETAADTIAGKFHDTFGVFPEVRAHCCKPGAATLSLSMEHIHLRNNLQKIVEDYFTVFPKPPVESRYRVVREF